MRLKRFIYFGISKIGRTFYICDGILHVDSVNGINDIVFGDGVALTAFRKGNAVDKFLNTDSYVEITFS